ncbi:hypothetical protein EBQ81_04600 [bacterium]|nr:hypothetical protein [bacterium]
MTNTKVSFFLDLVEDDSILNKIIDFLSKQYQIDDVFIFSKDLILSSVHRNFGTLPLYYFKFFKGTVVFFTLEDYLEYKDYGLNTNCYLYIDEKTIEDYNDINRNMLKDILMIALNKVTNEIESLDMRKL